MKRLSYSLFLIVLLVLLPSMLLAKVKVVTTTTDLASIAKEIGKQHVTVTSLTKGNSDLHYVQARPDFILRLNRADVFIQVGLELEIGWTPVLLKQSRNSKIQKGAAGYCFAYRGVPLLDKPSGQINRQMGDLHPYGNPHYWPDPVNGIIIARNIRDTLIKVDPVNSSAYKKNFINFKRRVVVKLRKMLRLMKQHKGKKIAVYHSEFVYILKRYGLRKAISIEKYPGVSPSPARIREVSLYIKKHNIGVVLVSPWSNIGYARKVARNGGAKLVILPIQTGSTRGTQTYIKMLDKVARLLYQNL